MVKTWSFIPAVIVFAAAIGALPNSSDDRPVQASPSPDAIIIVGKEKHWAVAELNKTALKFLEDKGEISKELKLQVIVHILPQHKSNMCEFLYLQGFEKPYWRVKIGFDGKILGFSKGIKKEG